MTSRSERIRRRPRRRGRAGRAQPPRALRLRRGPTRLDQPGAGGRSDRARPGRDRRTTSIGSPTTVCSTSTTGGSTIGSGPGAGRPAKVYRRSPTEIAVSLPPRDYELAGQLLADSRGRSQRDDVPIGDAIEQTAARPGRRSASKRSGTWAGAPAIKVERKQLLAELDCAWLRAGARGRRGRVAQLPVPPARAITYRAHLWDELVVARQHAGRVRQHRMVRSSPTARRVLLRAPAPLMTDSETPSRPRPRRPRR